MNRRGWGQTLISDLKLRVRDGGCDTATAPGLFMPFVAIMMGSAPTSSFAPCLLVLSPSISYYKGLCTRGWRGKLTLGPSN